MGVWLKSWKKIGAARLKYQHFLLLDKTCGALSPEVPIVCLSIIVSSSFIRNTSFFFNYSSITFSSTDFIDISKTRDQTVNLVPFWISFWAIYLWYRAFAVQNLIIFDGYVRTHTHTRTDGHTWFLETLPHNRPFGQKNRIEKYKFFGKLQLFRKIEHSS